MIARLMNWLYRRFGGLVESRGFRTVMNFVIFLNPIALAPQVWVAITAESVEGIALGMWATFVAIQLAFTFEGIRTKSAPIFLSMGVSLLESITIIIAVLVRRGGL